MSELSPEARKKEREMRRGQDRDGWREREREEESKEGKETETGGRKVRDEERE